MQKKIISLLWNFLEDPVWLFQKGITILIKTKSNLENIYHEWSFGKMGEKNKVTDVKNQLTGKKLGIEKFHPKRNRMSHYIALLLYSPQNAPNFSKQGGKYCTWKLPFGLSDRIPKNRKKKNPTAKIHTWNFVPDSVLKVGLSGLMNTSPVCGHKVWCAPSAQQSGLSLYLSHSRSRGSFGTPAF